MSRLHLIVIALFLTLTALLAVVSHARPLPPSVRELTVVDPPPQGEAQWVARNMRLNGLPMSVQAFSSRLRLDAVMHSYESWARTRGIDEMQRSQRDDWSILALKSPREYITIQARAALSGVEGTITVSPDPRGIQLDIETSFPRPGSARIVNLQQYDDDGLRAEHIGLISSRAVAVEAQAFAEVLSRSGWQVLRAGRASETLRGRFIEAQRGAQHSMITVQPDQAQPTLTAIIVVWRKS